MADNVFGMGLDSDQTNASSDDFGFIDFMNESNFEQFIELIRGENVEPTAKFCPNYDCEHISGCQETQIITGMTSTTSFPTTPLVGELFDFNVLNNNNSNNVNINNNNNPEFGGGNYSTSSPLLLRDDDDDNDPVKLGILMEENEGEHESSATNTTSTTITAPMMIPAKTKTTAKTDRSKTLISERKRRGRMKEKLYALRSLVPNITKMDKASIIGDAVLYIQDLQTNAKKLKAEIVNLERQGHDGHDHEHDQFQEKSIKDNVNNNAMTFFKVTANPPTPPPPAAVIKKILQMEVVQLEEREFYGRIVCNRDHGIAGLLYKALESLTSFKVHTSNLAALAQNYVLTFTLHVEVLEMEMEMEMMELPNLKLWIASVFLNLGFDFLELPQV